jgi:hypothetical protein
MRITVSPRGAKFDVGMGLALVSCVGALLLSLFIVLDALTERLTWLYPMLIVGCALIAALAGVLMRSPFSAAAFYTSGLFLGAVTLTCISTIAVAEGTANSAITRDIAASVVGGLVLLAMTLWLKRFARRRGESI